MTKTFSLPQPEPVFNIFSPNELNREYFTCDKLKIIIFNMYSPIYGFAYANKLEYRSVYCRICLSTTRLGSNIQTHLTIICCFSFTRVE